MKKKLAISVLLLICASLFAVVFSDGKKLTIGSDKYFSGNNFTIQIDINKESAYLPKYETAEALVSKGDKTGISELCISTDGSVDYVTIVKLFESNTELYMFLTEDDSIIAKAEFSSFSRDDFSSCLINNSLEEYTVGKNGPAGGIIFYDKGEYSDGWRYLEATTADLRVVSGLPSVDKYDVWYEFGYDRIVFGLYRKSYDGDNLFVNGTEEYNEKNCTGTAIGTGKRNTELLVRAIGSSAYSESEGSNQVSAYAAKLCYDLVYNGYDDWFLPSRDELNLIYTYLEEVEEADLGDYPIGTYWSSSENSNNVKFVWTQEFFDGYQNSKCGRFIVNSLRVRPIRAF